MSEPATKVCRKCGQELAIAEFYRKATGRDGRNAECRTCSGERARAWQAANQGRYSSYQANHRRKVRREVLDRYGGECACCGENTEEFLSIDHINGGGRQHRIAIKKNIYRWLRDNGFPQGEYQLLCHNCNLAKGFYGQCPHQPTPDEGTLTS